MNKMKKYLALVLSLLLLALPVAATETEAAPETLPPIYVGVANLPGIPENRDPLGTETAGKQELLELISEPLFRLEEGAPVPAQAAELPVDVTAEFAGQYGIPANAKRGYAFALSLREGAAWETGEPVTVADWYFVVEKLLERDAFPLEIANYQAYLRGDTLPAAEIISLMEAGFSSVAEAETAGYTDFYVETETFWGLDNTGWHRITDRTRLFDSSIPSGCEEMFVTPAYLYRRYLAGGSLSMFQSEFVGIPAAEGEKLTWDHVGLLAEEDRLVLILQESSAPEFVALKLTGLYPVVSAQYEENAPVPACGPYRVEEVTENEILLEPNPHWNGEEAEFQTIRCVTDS